MCDRSSNETLTFLQAHRPTQSSPSVPPRCLSAPPLIPTFSSPIPALCAGVRAGLLTGARTYRSAFVPPGDSGGSMGCAELATQQRPAAAASSASFGSAPRWMPPLCQTDGERGKSRRRGRAPAGALPDPDGIKLKRQVLPKLYARQAVGAYHSKALLIKCQSR